MSVHDRRWMFCVMRLLALALVAGPALPRAVAQELTAPVEVATLIKHTASVTRLAFARLIPVSGR